MREDLSEIRRRLDDDGCTGPHAVMDSKIIIPFQEMILDHMRAWLVGDQSGLSLVEKLRLPVNPETPAQVGLELRKKMIPVIENFANTNKEVRQIFEELLGTKGCQPCTMFQDFRGNMPVKGQPITGWHQDNETFFTLGKKEWRYPNYTMWTSLNGADELNSMELIPRSHRSRYLYAQHYSNLSRQLEEIAPDISTLPRVSFHIDAGQSYFLGPMTFHRSVPNQHKYARFSFDIRFFDPNPKTNMKYRVAPWLYIKRAELVTRQSKVYQTLASSKVLRKVLGRAAASK